MNVPEDFNVGVDGVRNDDAHALRTNVRLTPGDRVARPMMCRCGKDFGKLYDNAAKAAYREHRKTATN